MIKFAYTILYVKDVAKTVTFYENAFGFTKKFITPESDYAEIISGETIISFATIKLAKSNLSDGFIESNLKNKPFGIEIGFTTDDVESAFRSAVEAGAVIVEKPKTKPWGQIVSYVRDLDGFLIEICTTIA